jgi:hypothetical protein
MFSQQRVRSALLSTFAVLLLLLISAGAPGASVSQATTLSSPAAAGPAATLPCNLATSFNSINFPSSPNVNNPLLSYVPGTKFVLEGRVNVGGQPLAHQVVLIVTDLTKMVHGVKTVVLWDRDFNTGVLTESELAFHTQDNAGNIWNLGEYPAQYSGGQFTEAPDTWFEGLANGKGGLVIPGNPQVGTPKFLQAYAPGIIGDCGQVAAVGIHFCNVISCYDNVLVVDETSPPELGTQQKYYAPGVGNFHIGATDNDPQGETLVLSQTVQLGRDDCIAARQAALALEDQAYNHDNSQTVYDLTQTTVGYGPMEQTGFCETIPLPPTPTPTPTPPISPTPTPPGTPQSVYLPMISHALAPIPPAIYDGCKSDPNPAGATNFPVRIVNVDKVAEVVTLQNISDKTISLEDWNMCSLGTNQDHDQIFGTIAPGQTRSFPNVGDPNVWNNNQRNDGALYNAAGFLVSYWVDQ